MTPSLNEKQAKEPMVVPEHRHRSRIAQVLLIFVMAYGLVAIRLVVVHTCPDPMLTQEEMFHVGYDPLVEPRGKIYDRDMNLLATQRLLPSLWANPSKLGEEKCTVTTEGLVRLCQERLGMDPAETRKKLAASNESGKPMRFVWVKRWIDNLTDEQREAVVEEGGGVLEFRDESVRFYPQGDTAAHVLGFVNRAGEASEGLELSFNKHLASVTGRQEGRCVPNMGKTDSDANRILLPSLTTRYEAAKPGEDVILTIDSAMQHSLERALDERMVHCEASVGMGIIMDPYTGAILALATRPAFDPNNYDTTAPELRKNRAMLDIFEPGSSFKIVTASAAIEHGLITKNTLIDTEGGSLHVPGHVVRDVHRFPGPVPFEKCFTESSNVAMIKVAAMVGPERFDQWIQHFGFGKRTSKDFQYESAGAYRPRSQWSRSSMYALPFGNEIAVTIPQLIRAFAVIANGGYLVQPYVVERAFSPSGDSMYTHTPDAPDRIMSTRTVEVMRELCEGVVLEGTGKQAAIPEYRVSGKTGTSKMLRKGGGYDDRRYTSIFAGFAPSSNPKLVAVIAMQEAKMGKHWGGYACAPVFAKVIRESLVRLQVPGDKPVDEKEKALFLAKSGGDKPGETKTGAPKKAQPVPEEATPEEAASLEDSPIIDIDESPEYMVDSLALVPAAHRLAGPAPTLPDLMGMTKRQAQKRLAELGIAWDMQGAGWVVRQEPAAGTPLSAVPVCALVLTGKQTDPAIKQEPDKKAGDAPTKGKTTPPKAETDGTADEEA